MIHTHPFLFVLLILGAISLFLAVVLRGLAPELAARPYLADFRVRLVALGLLFAAIVTLWLNAQ